MWCPACGARLPVRNARFCDSCGEAVVFPVPNAGQGSGDRPEPPDSSSAADPYATPLVVATDPLEGRNEPDPDVAPDGAESALLDPGDQERPPPTASRERRWARRAGIAALYSLALLGFGIVIGWMAVGHMSPPPPATEIVEVPIVAAQNTAVTMPDIRGLSEQNARTALTDAGIPAETLSVDSRPAAGTPGVVIVQDPAYGTANPNKVTLTISTAAAVPDVAGQPEADATAELLALGARVEVERAYDPNVDPGDVIGTRPGAGKPIDDAVTLTIAEAPGSVYLTQLKSVEGSNSCSTTVSILSGQQYDNALSCSADTETQEYVWLLGDKVDQFVGTIGVPDDGDQAAQARVRILVDGDEVASGTASYTKPLPIDVSTKGGTQLQIRLTNPAKPDGDSGFFSSSSSVPVIVGDGRFIGSSAKINELAGWAEQ